jgi:ADP-ribose pyrophosphatase
MGEGWEVVERREILDASPWLKVVSETVLLEDGETLIPDFYRIDMPPYVVMCAVTDECHVALIEHYKHGLRRRVIELPAGYIDPGEDPLTSAQRELLEETGLEAPEWHPLGVFTIDGNRGCGQAYAFLALHAQQVTAPNPGDLEHQAVHFFELERVRSMWLAGEFATIAAAAVIGLGLAHAQV